MTPEQIAGAGTLSAVKTLLDNLPVRAEIISVKAKICKIRYDEAISAGFNDTQALFLCTRDWDL